MLGGVGIERVDQGAVRGSGMHVIERAPPGGSVGRDAQATSRELVHAAVIGLTAGTIPHIYLRVPHGRLGDDRLDQVPHFLGSLRVAELVAKDARHHRQHLGFHGLAFPWISIGRSRPGVHTTRTEPHGRIARTAASQPWSPGHMRLLTTTTPYVCPDSFIIWAYFVSTWVNTAGGPRSSVGGNTSELCSVNRTRSEMSSRPLAMRNSVPSRS